jgi:hypothetical protein
MMATPVTSSLREIPESPHYDAGFTRFSPPVRG